MGQSYNLSYNVDVKARISSIKKLTDEIQKGLNKVSLPMGSSKSFNSSISTILDELKELDRLSSKTSLSLADTKNADKSWSKIDDALGRIKTGLKDLGLEGVDAAKSIEKLFPESTKNKIKQLTSAIEKTQKALKGEDDSTESKRLKQRLKELEVQKKIAEDARKEKKLSEKEERELQAKQRIIKESTEERRAQGKFGFDDSKKVKNYLGDLEKIKKIREEIKEAGKQKKQDKSQENIDTYENLKKERDRLISNFNKKYGTLLKGQGQNDQGDFTKSIEKYKKAIEEIAPLQEKFNKFSENNSAVEKLDSQIEEVAQSLDKLGKTKGQQALSELTQTVSELTGKNINEIPKDLGEIEKIVANFKTDNVKELLNYLKQVGNSANIAEKETEALKKSLEGTKQDVFSQDQARQDIERLQYQIRDFFSISNTIQIFKRTVRDAFETVKELDAVMTETAVVTDFTVSDMWDKLPEYAKKASELGSSITGLYKATTLYYQQGLGDVAAMDVGTETMKMARIANMDAADATEAMTAALRGFNMEIDKTSAARVNDVYSELAAITAADTSQIATAMTKTASIASSANMEFETTAAFLAQIIETTQEAPETAGTAMKTIIARFTEVKELFSQGMLTGEDTEGEAIEINKIDKALQSVGISLKDFLLGKKGIDDIFLELAAKWDTLDLATQRYIATTAAGSRQQSRFIAMMSDYDRTMELVNAANNSAGSSQEQFDKTLDSLDAKLQRLQNAWQRFTMGIVDSDLFKGAIDLLTGLLEAINSVTEALGDFGGPLAKIGLIGGALKLGGSLLGQKTGLGNLLTPLMKKEGGGAATQTFKQTLASEAKGFISQTSFGQKYLMADSVLGRIWGKFYRPYTGADAPKKNPYYQKAADYINRRKELKQQKGILEQEILSDKKKLDSMPKAKSWKDLDFSGEKLDTPQKRQKYQEWSKSRSEPAKQRKAIQEKEAQLSEINKELSIPKQKLKTFGKHGGYAAAIGLAAMIGGDIAEGAGQAQGKENMEAWGTGIKSAGATAAVLGTLSGALAAFGMAIPGANVIIAATAALAGLYKGLEKAAYLKSDEHALEMAQANKKVAEETAQKEQERVKSMTALTDDLQEKYSNIDSMTKGTSEWKKAVAELNQEIADTIVQVPELAGAFKMEDGVLRADQTKLTEIIKGVEEQAQFAETNAAIADYEETVAENNLTASDLYDSLFSYSLGKKWGADDVKRDTFDKLLTAYNQGQINNIRDIEAIAGSVNLGTTFEQVIAGINQYSGIKAQTSAAQAAINQKMISSAQATRALTDEQAETISNLSESFLNDFYEESRAAAQEGLDDWGYFDRRDNRIKYASENNLKYKGGFFGWGSKFVDANGNPVEVTDDMIRSEEINIATQQEYRQRAQNFANILKSNPLLARAMSVGGGQLEQADLDQMSKMFGKTETGDLVFDAKKFAESIGFKSAEELAKEMGFEGKEDKFFGQIAQNFQSRLENNLSAAMDNVQMANALKLTEEAVKAFNTTELQTQANDFYSLVQMRNMDTDAMRAGMEVFADLAEVGDTNGMEQLSEFVSEINFNNPIKAYEQLQRAAERGTYAEKQYANAIIKSGSQMIGTGAQLQYFLRSEDFDSVWEELEGIVELNGTIEPEDILDLADSYDVLNDLMKQTGISAVGLGKAIELVGEGMMSADSMTDAVIAALSAMSSIDEEIARGLKDAASFNAGQDENQAAGFISQAYETLNANIEKGAWGNSQNAAYLDELFGTGWRSDNAETQAQNIKDLTKFLSQNVENMSDAWRMAARGETLVGGNKSALDALGLTLDAFTGEVRMGNQVASMNSDQIVDAISTGFGVSEQMARLMLADFKNYSKDFDLLLSIAKNDEVKGTERFKQQINQRSDIIGRNGQVKKAVDRAELQTTALAFGYKDTPQQTAGQQYAAAHGIISENGYLVTDFYNEDGSRKGGRDLSRALGAMYMGVDVYSMQNADEQQQKSWETAFASQGSDFYTTNGIRTVTGTWNDYINTAATGLGRQIRQERANAVINKAQKNIGLGQYASYNEAGRTWLEYIESANDKAKAESEYNEWLAKQQEIVKGTTWTQFDVPEFDYEGMTKLMESYGATAEEAASAAQSQIDAQLDATNKQYANLKMWSDVLGDYVEVEYQKGDNIQREFQAIEAQKKQEQQIATLRDALGMDEGGALKVAIEGITEGENTTVTFEPNTDEVDAARQKMAEPIDVKVSFSGSGSVTATGSAGGTFTVQLAAHASGIVDAPNTHDALLGEGGPELVQTKNGAWIAGLNGPEVGTIHKGDTVYTAKETKQIFNPKKNSMPRFEGGTGPGAYGNVKSGGKSGGKSASSKDSKDWENPFDKLYNLLRKIDEELRVRERIERRYEKLLEDLNVSANKIVDISRKELNQLEEEKILQEKLITERKEQIKQYLAEDDNEKYSKYATAVEKENGDLELRIDWDAIDAVKDKEEGEGIKTFVGQLENWIDDVNEAEEAIWKIEDAMQDIIERGEDEYFDLEDLIKDALEESYKKEIDKLEDINDSINNTNAELLEGIQKTIDKQRQDKENEKTEEELSDKQRRLAYLQMDTSGANALEILQLQKEIEEGQEDYTDSLIDQKISELQEQNDEAAKQREKQIDLLQAQLDNYLETGRIWQEVYQLMDDGLDKDDGLIRGSRLQALLQDEASFKGLSAIGQQEWWIDMDQKIAQALAYLEVGRQIENLGVKKGTEIEFYTEDGKKLKGKVDDKGNVTTADGTMYNNVYQGANGLYYAGENYEIPKEPEAGGIAKGPDSGGSKEEENKKKGPANNYSGAYIGKKETRTREIQGPTKKSGFLITEQREYGYMGWSSWKVIKKVRKINDIYDMEYASGGLADFTGPAWLDGTKSRPELVLNQRDTQNFIQLKDILSSLFSHKLGDSISTENNGDITYDIDINVESIQQEADLDRIASYIERKIVDNARYRNVNTVSRSI